MVSLFRIDDNDGWNDTTEIDCSTNSTDPQSTPLDTDGDGICDVYDDDIDNDEWNNTSEEDCGTSSTDSHSTPLDTDGDGICDNLDTNDDNVPEQESVTEPEPVTTDVTNNDIPGFTSVLMFTATAGALMHLKRRRND